MSKVVFKAKSKQFNNGWLLLPATSADKQILNTFGLSADGKYITVTANYSKADKSYDQVKTVFALINIYFFNIKGRYPTEQEQALTYSKLLWKYAPRTEDPTDPNNTIPITLSHMSKSEAAIFISGIMAEIYENKHGLTDNLEIQLKDIFEEFYKESGFGINNPVDYDDSGNLLSEDEWRQKNNFSFASGIQIEGLQLHHILTKGGHEAIRDCSWNWLMLTFEEHRLYHDKGFEVFLELYPHLAPRIKNAYDMAKEIYPLDLVKALKKLGLYEEPEKTKPLNESYSLVDQALEIF